MAIDPSAFTVKEAVKKLSKLSDSELSALYDAELDGKGRKSLLDEITSKRDALRESGKVKRGGSKIRPLLSF